MILTPLGLIVRVDLAIDQLCPTLKEARFAMVLERKYVDGLFVNCKIFTRVIEPRGYAVYTHGTLYRQWISQIVAV